MNILKILTFCLILNLHLLNDFTRINAGKKINHFIITIPRLIIFGILSIWGNIEISKTIQWFINLNLVYWLFFDLILNHLRNKPLDYIGRVAYSDKILRYLNIKNVVVFKILLLFIINIIFLFI